MSSEESNFLALHLQRIRIVLVETRTPGNIGSTARAMKTMGLSDLYLINPARPKAHEAYLRAVGSEDILEQARQVSCLDEALEECTLVVAVSGKATRLHIEQQRSTQFANHLKQVPLTEKIAILFGREATGLHRHELERCNLHVYIPSSPAQPSLNLAAAVQVITYEIYAHSQSDHTASLYTSKSLQSEKISNVALESYLKHLEQVLIELKILDPQKPRQLMTRLRRLYQREHIERAEMNILRGMLVKVQRLIKKSSD